MQRSHYCPSHQCMPVIACFVPMESRNYFHHGELLLVTFREVHSRNLVWCLFGDSYAGSESIPSFLVYSYWNNFVNDNCYIF